MAYDICKKCQRFFEKSGKSYCQECDGELKESHEKINEYLETNPSASILDIVRETKVKLKDVNIFLESGGAVSIPTHYEGNIVNLRREEMKKQDELMEKKESLKMKNKFKPRRLRE